MSLGLAVPWCWDCFITVPWYLACQDRAEGWLGTQPSCFVLELNMICLWFQSSAGTACVKPTTIGQHRLLDGLLPWLRSPHTSCVHCVRAMLRCDWQAVCAASTSYLVRSIVLDPSCLIVPCYGMCFVPPVGHLAWPLQYGRLPAAAVAAPSGRSLLTGLGHCPQQHPLLMSVFGRLTLRAHVLPICRSVSDKRCHQCCKGFTGVQANNVLPCDL